MRLRPLARELALAVADKLGAAAGAAIGRWLLGVQAAAPAVAPRQAARATPGMRARRREVVAR